MRVVNSVLLQSSGPSIFMKLSPAVGCWPRLGAMAAGACHPTQGSRGFPVGWQGEEERAQAAALTFVC